MSVTRVRGERRQADRLLRDSGRLPHLFLSQRPHLSYAKRIASLRNDHQSALAEERTLAAALEEQKGAAMDLNRKNVN